MIVLAQPLAPGQTVIVMPMQPLADPTQEQLSHALLQLTHVPFYSFHTGVTQDDARLLRTVGVATQCQYNNFGNLDSLHSTIVAALEEQGQSEAEGAEVFIGTICRIVPAIVRAFHAETAWITLRSFPPTSQYEARWHQDGIYFTEPEDPRVQHKAVFTLNRAGTLFGNLPIDAHAAFAETEEALSRAYGVGDAGAAASLQRRLNAMMPHENIIQSQATFEGVLFNVGDPERAAVHSEPFIESPGWFISVVPGSGQQVASLKRRWNK